MRALGDDAGATMHEHGAQFARWSTATLDPRGRFEAWTEALCATHLEWTVRAPEAPPRYEGVLERHALGEVSVVQCACDPLAGERARREIARSSAGYFGVVLVREGEETLRVASEQLGLRAGEFALWDSERAMAFQVPTRLTKVSLLVPKHRLERIVTDPTRFLGKVVRATHGAGALAAQQLLALAQHAGTLEASAHERVVDSTLELFGAAFCAASPTDDRARASRLKHIRAWVCARLADPSLSPARVAHAHGLAVRTLHAWFQTEGESFSRWMQRERLERCKHLARPLRKHHRGAAPDRPVLALHRRARPVGVERLDVVAAQPGAQTDAQRRGQR